MKMFFWFFLIILYPCIVITELFSAEIPAGNETTSFLVDTKCSKCHTIKRVFIHARTEEEWRGIIEVMMNKVPEWISPSDAKQILNEITMNWRGRVQEIVAERKEYDDNRLLFLDRCTVCHPVNRILKKSRNPEDWKEIVARMRSEASEYITEEDATRIATFLSKRAEVLTEDTGSSLFVEKCLVCHPPGEKLLLEKHNRVEWERIVKDRQQYARKATPQVIIGHEEAKLIVELLVKTQGEKME